MVSALKFKHGVTERFLRYVAIDTQSDPTSPTCPSTAKQKHLGALLARELQEIGVSDAHLDEHGYVYATIPANTDKDVPVICFCSHMDTSPDCSGTDVKPQIVRNYRGGDIVLPDDPTQIIRAAEHPALADQIGNDIITTDGTTLLGADNKAGVAEIMDAAQFLIENPRIEHGAIKILFTPDEEIGRGVDKVDLKKLGADFAYTMDGESAGNIEDETFSADGAVVIIEGVSVHPGYAKGKMEHAIKIVAAIVDRLPKESCSPESTDGRQGFLHPVGISGALEKATVSFIVRDFTDEGLQEKKALLENIVREVMTDYPRSSYRIEVKPQYRNMKEVIDRHPQLIDNAMEAIRRAGLKPKRTSIRGGTDGSRLSFMGLPCPNIFAGEHAFHSRLEWVSVQDMEAAGAHDRASGDDLGRTGMRSVRKIAFAIAALILLAPLKARAADMTYDITVKADGTKANGNPWDGIAGLGNAKANLNAAPDIALCVVRANAKPDCLWRPAGRRLFSLCQNAFTCRFPGVALQPLPVGLVLIDIDVRNHDIIDIVILTGNENAAADAEIKGIPSHRDVSADAKPLGEHQGASGAQCQGDAIG